jgi:hypothetical protein
MKIAIVEEENFSRYLSTYLQINRQLLWKQETATLGFCSF